MKENILQEMIEIYKPDLLDWMSYQITVKNVLTLHHIIEQVKGGVTNIDNLALLTKRAHRILNMLQSRDIILYNDWQDLFKYINDSKSPLDDYAIKYSRSLKKQSQNIIYK